MAAGKLRDLNEAELAERLIEASEELFNLRFQLVTGQLDNYARLGQVRKDVARIKTVQRERQLAQGEGPGQAAPGGRGSQEDTEA